MHAQFPRKVRAEYLLALNLALCVPSVHCLGLKWHLLHKALRWSCSLVCEIMPWSGIMNCVLIHSVLTVWVSDICIVTYISVFFSLIVSLWLFNPVKLQAESALQILFPVLEVQLWLLLWRYCINILKGNVHPLKRPNRGMQRKRKRKINVFCWVHGYMFLIFMLA